MSDDDFFHIKSDCSLQYIKCKTSTKIDDILKRRRNQKKKLKDSSNYKSDEFLSLDNSENENEYISNDDKKVYNEDDIIYYNNNKINIREEQTCESIHMFNGINKNNVDIIKNDKINDDNINDDNINGDNINDNNINDDNINGDNINNDNINNDNTNNDNINNDNINNDSIYNNYYKQTYQCNKSGNVNNFSRGYFSNTYEKGNTYLLKNSSEEMLYNKDHIRNRSLNNLCFQSNLLNRRSNIYTFNDLSSFENNKKSSLYAKCSDILQKYDSNKLNIKPTEDIYTRHNRSSIIFQNNSKEFILSKLLSNNDSKDELFNNLNKIYSNDIDLNKTPSKSLSKGYIEYLKYETAGKMNLSELETPLNMKEDEGNNTPFITYFLAGKTESKTMNEENNDDIINNNNNDDNNSNIYKCRSNNLIDTLLNRHIQSNCSIKNNEGNTNIAPTHSNTEHNKGEHIYNAKVSNNIFEDKKNICDEKKKKLNDITSSQMNNEKCTLNTSLIRNKNTDNNQDNVMAYNNSSTLFDKIKSSQKISFIKTEEEYINMLKKDEKDNIPINILNKNSNNKIFSSNNNVSFADNIFSNNKSYMDNTKIYSEDYINLEKQKSEIFLQEKENIMNHLKNKESITNKINDDIIKNDYQNDFANNYEHLISSISKKENENKQNNYLNNDNIENNILDCKNFTELKKNKHPSYDNNTCDNIVNKQNNNDIIFHNDYNRVINEENIPQRYFNNQPYININMKRSMSLCNLKDIQEDDIKYDHIIQNVSNHNMYNMYSNTNKNIKRNSNIFFDNTKGVLLENIKENESYTETPTGRQHLNINSNNMNNMNNMNNIYNNMNNIYEHKKCTSNVQNNMAYNNENNFNVDLDQINYNPTSKNNIKSDNNESNKINVDINNNVDNKNSCDDINYVNGMKKYNISDNNQMNNLQMLGFPSYNINVKNNNNSYDNNSYDNSGSGVILSHNNLSNNNNSNKQENCENYNTMNQNKKKNIYLNMYDIQKENLNEGKNVAEKLILSTLNKNINHKLSETADFGYKENDHMNESKNSDNTIKIVNNNLYNDNDSSLINDINLKQYWTDYIMNNMNNVNNMNNMNNMNNTQNNNKLKDVISFNTFCKDMKDENIFNQFLREHIKNSINNVVEEILNDKQNEILKNKIIVSDINNKEIYNKVNENNNNLSDKHYEKGVPINNNYNMNNDHILKEDKIVSSENSTKLEDNVIIHKNVTSSTYNNGMNNTNISQMKEANITNNNIIGNVENICSDENVCSDENIYNNQNIYCNNKKKKHKDENSFKHSCCDIQFNQDDLEEILKLNNLLKSRKVNKLIQIKKDDINIKKASWKNISYNCIDIIYYLIHENNKKNNKMNTLINDINNINEYEKKIEYLNKENEKLKIEMKQKNDNEKKKELKEKASLNNKILEQSKKITNFEKDIYIYKNKLNKLNNKVINKDIEINKLKKQYQVILEEIENCKNDANIVLKKVLNKKNTNLIDKQCVDISKYYQILINSLNDEIKNLKHLIKCEAKDKIILKKKINQLTQSNQNESNKNGYIEKNKTDKKCTNDSYISQYTNEDEHINNIDNDTYTNNSNIQKSIEYTNSSYNSNIIKKDINKSSNNSNCHGNSNISSTTSSRDMCNDSLNEQNKYKILYEDLIKQMNEIKKDHENEKIIYNKKIEQLAKHQEMQNIKNQLDTSEKIVEVYQHIFKENINNIRNDNVYSTQNNQQKSMDYYNLKNDIYNKHSSLTYLNDNRNENDEEKNKNNFDHIFNSNVNQSNIFNNNSSNNNIYNQDNHMASHILSNGDILKQDKNYISKDNKLIHVLSNNINNNNIMGCINSISSQNNYLNKFLEMYIEKNSINNEAFNIYMNNLNKQKQNEEIKEINQNVDKSNILFEDNNINNKLQKENEHKNKLLLNILMKYNKTDLINIFVDICNHLKTDNISIVIHFIKFLSFIVYEQFPLYTSFYYTLTSLISLGNVKFDEYINIIKKWKSFYISGQQYYLFRRKVLLIFQSDLKDIEKSQLDKKCIDLIQNNYDRNKELSTYTDGSFEKAEYILNKHSKEIISKIIKTYMNLYNIDKISNIIAHMNSLNSKIKTQSYFIRSISSCLNLNKVDNFQEIEKKIKELITTREIGEKIKNKIKIEDIDEYLAAFTIMSTLKKYLNITHTKDLLPSISKIIQKNKCSS